MLFDGFVFWFEVMSFTALSKRSLIFICNFYLVYLRRPLPYDSNFVKNLVGCLHMSKCYVKPLVFFDVSNVVFYLRPRLYQSS